MPTSWTAESVMELARAYQEACVLAAAVDFDIFTHLAGGGSTPEELAAAQGSDVRAMRVLLDALTALDLLEKAGQRYRVPAELVPFVTSGSPCSVLPMLQHQANCMRRWVHLPWVVKTGRPADRSASIRGAEADRTAFLEAMNCVSVPLLTEIITALQPLRFSHLLDVGGATGTWTIAFLRAVPTATATIFDLPDALPLAKRRLLAEGLGNRVHLVGGDFYDDPLPKGADLTWLGAIIHQNSRAQNRELLAKVYEALAPGGQVVIRDIIMDPTHTRPPRGALFAINMLVATDGGGTYSFDEISEDLSAAGFGVISLVRRGKAMDSLVRATKPRQLPPD
jgi:SAM-dependent methyltransferase